MFKVYNIPYSKSIFTFPLYNRIFYILLLHLLLKFTLQRAQSILYMNKTYQSLLTLPANQTTKKIMNAEAIKWNVLK